MTTTAARPLARPEVAYLRETIARDLKRAGAQEQEFRTAHDQPRALYWGGRVTALQDTLSTLDRLCTAEPWDEY